MRTGKVLRLAVVFTLAVWLVVPQLSVVHAQPNSQAGGLPALAAKVSALQAAVSTLQSQVATLQDNGVGAGIVAARIVGLPSQHGLPENRFGAISGTSDQNLDPDSVGMLSPPVPVVAQDLSVNFTSAPLGGNRTVTLLVNGVPSQLSCQASGSQSACTDTQHQVQIPSASNLVLQVHSENLVIFTVPATDAQVTWRAVTP
jgi:hypothetical protein